jgi:hypothetical protein
LEFIGVFGEVMMKKERIVTKTFSYLELTGSSYEVGKQQGLVVKDNPDALKYFTKGSFKSEISGFSSLEETLEFYESYVPGLTDEFKGFADGAGVSIEQLVPIDYPNSIQNHCSHIACCDYSLPRSMESMPMSDFPLYCQVEPMVLIPRDYV